MSRGLGPGVTMGLGVAMAPMAREAMRTAYCIVMDEKSERVCVYVGLRWVRFWEVVEIVRSE